MRRASTAAAEAAAPPPAAQAAAPQLLTARLAAEHARTDFARWAGSDLTVFPPTGIETKRASWLYCALIAEILGAPQFPYARQAAFSAYEFECEVLGRSVRLPGAWGSWVAAFRLAMANIVVTRPGAFDAVPPRLHWADDLQDAVAHVVFEDDDDRPVPQQVFPTMNAFVVSLGVDASVVLGLRR